MASLRSEDRGEQAHRDSYRTLHDARIEIDIRIKFALDEVFVLERDLFQGHGELEQTIVVQAERFKHLVTGLAHELGSRIIILVHAMAESHQLDSWVLVFRALGEVADLRNVADLLEQG